MQRLVLPKTTVRLPRECFVCGGEATSRAPIQDQRMFGAVAAASGRTLMLPVPVCGGHKRRYWLAKVVSVLMFAASVLIWVPIGLAAAPHLPDGSLVLLFLAAGVQGYLLLRFGGRWVDLHVVSMSIRRVGANELELRFKSDAAYERVRELNRSQEPR